MVKIIGIRFRTGGKVYYFDPLDLELKKGSRVIVETARGVECGQIVLGPKEVEENEVVQPLRPVIRVATEEDLQQEKENAEKEKEAYRICKEKIREHELDMKLVAAECTFDGKKMLFYFTADGRVDFRELVKDLAWVFRTRIELRQIGVRDETKLLGGIGICGRPLCCASYLSDFAPVSIKMAKEQNLSLNPTKISGVCGRLMCCLKNEEEAYEYLNKSLPGIGDIVETPDGRQGIVQSVNVIRQGVRVLIEEGDDKEMESYPASEIVLISKRKKGGGHQAVVREIPPTDDEKAIIEMLEESGRQEKSRRDNKAERREQDPKNGGRRQENAEERSDKKERKENSHRQERGDRERSDENKENERGSKRDRNRRDKDRKDRENGRDRESGKNRENGRDLENSKEREYGRDRENGKNRENGRNSENGKDRENGRELENGKDRENSRGRSRRGSGRRNHGNRPEGEEAVKITHTPENRQNGPAAEPAGNDAQAANGENTEKRHRRRHRRRHSGSSEQAGAKEE